VERRPKREKPPDLPLLLLLLEERMLLPPRELRGSGETRG